MKTHIIQLNNSDDYLSIRDKMEWSQARRIVLVWSEDSKVLQRELDFKLAKQHAIALGIQLAVITKDSRVRFMAQQVGLPVFDNILQAQNSEWEPFQPKVTAPDKKARNINQEEMRQARIKYTPELQEQPRVRMLSLCISLMAVFGLVGFILPGATITITPKIVSQTMLFDILADPSTSMINYSKGSLPAYSLEAVVNGEEAIRSSDTVTFPDQPARGELSFSNSSDESITIPVRTIVRTEGNNPIRFIITSKQEITIKPEESVVLEAKAMKPGLSGNLEKNQVVVVEGSLASFLTVTNLTATTGGTQKTIPSPNSTDQERVRKQLLSQLEQTALEKMQTEKPEGDWIITPTLTLVETISEAYFPKVGDPGNNLSLKMEVRFQAQVVSKEALHQLVEPIMDANTPKGYIKIPNSLVFSQTDQPVIMEDGKAQFTLSFERAIRADITEGQVTQSIRGVSIIKAVERLAETLPLGDEAQINLFPSWWPRLPWLGERIQVIQTESDENFSH